MQNSNVEISEDNLRLNFAILSVFYLTEYPDFVQNWSRIH